MIFTIQIPGFIEQCRIPQSFDIYFNFVYIIVHSLICLISIKLHTPGLVVMALVYSHITFSLKSFIAFLVTKFKDIPRTIVFPTRDSVKDRGFPHEICLLRTFRVQRIHYSQGFTVVDM